jgi:hypothetical protein
MRQVEVSRTIVFTQPQGPGVVPFWCDVPGLSVCGVAA